MEIARSFSRKISLTQYGHPYETIDLFASYKADIEEQDKPSAIKVLSQKLQKLAVADIEEQEKEVRAYYEAKKQDLNEANQTDNKSKAEEKKRANQRAFYAKKAKTEKIVEKLNTDPEFRKEYAEKAKEGSPF